MDQERALELMKEGHNIFLTGAAGAGKSYTVRQFIKWAREEGKKVAITASSGIAASHISGTTIHTWAGIGIKSHLSEGGLKAIKNKIPTRDRIQETDVLIIDEISMLHYNQFDLVNIVLQYVRGNNYPFGGLQLIVIGDFCQLKPVDTSPENVGKDDKIYCFMSPSWKEANFKVCYLTKIYRQAEGNRLTTVLNNIRNQTVSQEDYNLIRSTRNNQLSSDNPTQLFSRNIDVEKINAEKLEEIPFPLHSFNATEEGNKDDILSLYKTGRIFKTLNLKLSAKVIITVNDYSNEPRQYVNGTQGVIESFISNDLIKVRKLDGESVLISRHNHELEVNDKVVATVTQFPLRLAYAITVHKCIGPDTLVNTHEGLLPIKHISPSGFIETEKGFLFYENKVKNENQDCLEVSLFESPPIIMSLDHKCKVYDRNTKQVVIKEAKDLNYYDSFIIKKGNHSLDFFESPSLKGRIKNYSSFIKGFFFKDYDAIDSSITISPQSRLYFLKGYSSTLFRKKSYTGSSYNVNLLYNILLYFGIKSSYSSNNLTLSENNLDRLRELIDDENLFEVKYVQVPITNISKTTSSTYCVTVKDTGEFIQNGYTLCNSQGMTLNEAEMDLSTVFDYSQGYVALSRVESLEGLKVTGSFRDIVFELNPLAVRADKRFKELSSANVKAQEIEEILKIKNILLSSDITTVDKKHFEKEKNRIIRERSSKRY